MLSSQYFYKKAKKLIFAENPDPNVVLILREEFERAINHLPSKMTEDIGDYFFDFVITEYSQLIEEVEKLLPIIDLLNNQWDEDCDDLSDEELIYISELVNEFATVLDMDFVTDIMRIIIKRKLL